MPSDRFPARHPSFGAPVLLDPEQAAAAGWCSFQALYDRTTSTQPDLLEA